MILWAILMLALQAWSYSISMSTVMVDEGMVAIALIMLASGGIMAGKPGDETGMPRSSPSMD